MNRAQAAEERADTLAGRVDSLEPALAQALSDLDSARRQVVEIDHDWRERLRMETTGFRYEVKRTVSHELDGMQAALDRPEPNVRMALSRVRNIERYLERLGDA